MQIQVGPKALNSQALAGLAAALNFQLPAGQAPEWIELIPAGVAVVGRDGRKWINDAPDTILAAFNASGRELVIDTEHATEIKAPKGDPAPAAGWVKALEIRAGAIWGRTEWTPAGAASVANREYRYISPVFYYDKPTGRIVQLLSIGLTNRPNLRLMALNQEGANPPQEAVMLKKLLKALGLAEDASEETALNAIGTLQGDLSTARNSAQTPSLEKFVPRPDYDAALARAQNAEQALKTKTDADLATAINAEVDAALKAGKITPATAEYHKANCRAEGGLERFRAFVAAAPVIGDPSGLDAKKPAAGVALNSQEVDVLNKMGLSEEQYKKYNPAQ